VVGSDPKKAAQDLQEVDERLSRGAHLALPHTRWLYPMICLVFVLSGAVRDAPSAWRWSLGILHGATLVTLIVLLVRRRHARPLPAQLPWRAWLAVGLAAAGCLGITLGMYFVLRHFETPAPFTVSGLVLGLAVSLLTWRIQRSSAGYVQRVRRGQW
jgi:hypothetical protein